MGQETLVRSVRAVVDSKRILDVLLRNLINKKNITPEDLDTILASTIRKVADTVAAQAVSIFMVDKKVGRIRFLKCYYSPSLYGMDDKKKKSFEDKAKQLEAMTLGMDQGIVGAVVKSGQTRFVADTRSEKDFYSMDKETGFATLSMIAAPLKSGDQVVGVIEVMNKCPDGKMVYQFTQEDVILLEDVASYTAKIIQRAFDPAAPINDKDMAVFYARMSKCPFQELGASFEPNRFLLESVGEEKLKKHLMLPLEKLADKNMRVAMVNPLDFQKIQDFEIMTGTKISEKVVCTEKDIKEALNKIYPEAEKQVGIDEAEVMKNLGLGGIEDPAAGNIVDGVETEDENAAPIVKLANDIIVDAYVRGASDIHVEPREGKLIVRYRTDGVCKEVLTLPTAAHKALISRLKIMSDLNIAERRIPQDGRIVFKKFNNKYDLDLRVSVAPMNYGEKICMRILDKTKSCLPLEKLGFSDYNLGLYRKIIQCPYGMILHCGPTGSGKSMTLFAALNEINDPQWNISTAEDPIEYSLPGLNQMQVKKDIGLTFAAALRCYLRQDPDIILVGETRDTETAQIAIEAALTGHVLFSTLHTNDAPSTITRLEEMGIERFVISTALVAICAQRLIRRLCGECKVTDSSPKPEELDMLRRAKTGCPIKFITRPGGCPKCGNSGYKGRTGIHELLVMTDDLKEVVNKGGTVDDLKRGARKSGMRTLFEDAMEKAIFGTSSLVEAIANVRPDDEFEKAPIEGVQGYSGQMPKAGKEAPKAETPAPEPAMAAATSSGTSMVQPGAMPGAPKGETGIVALPSWLDEPANNT